MERFAFILHPLSVADVAKKLPLLQFVPEAAVEWIIGRKQPFVASQIQGIKSQNGTELSGVFIALPMLPGMFSKDPVEATIEKIVRCTELAHAEGAKIIGLGAFTSVVGDGGISVAKSSPIAVTTGNSYTVATAIEGTLLACEQIGIHPELSRLAVVGATGSIGKTCAQVLSGSFGSTLLIGRDLARTEAAAASVVRAEVSTSMRDLLSADVVVTVTSSDTAVIEPSQLRHGAIVCDVARPRDVSVKVRHARPDVLVIEGGVVTVPGDVEFGLNFGFPAQTAYACMSETMMLALDKRYENFTLGKDVTVAQVAETQEMALRHGFKLSGFRSFEREVTDADIERVRKARSQARAS
jgi:fatty aldehyde-generating acyl-ACP reductase